MGIQERILTRFSVPPEELDASAGQSSWTLDNALRLLEREFPQIADLVTGKRVADFGCGAGYQSIALATRYDCAVVGIDTHRGSLTQATELARAAGLPASRASFTDRVPESGGFDVVISQNSFEHFPDPARVLAEMRRLTAAGGRILITFGPPWLSPYGSHMHLFCRIPWVNILFSERAVMKVRSRYRSDGATRYEEVESGLNKMTVARFGRIVAGSGLRVEYGRHRAIKGLDLLTRVPLARELFTNRISVVLVWAG